MKSINLIKTINGVSKVIGMPENIWNTILNSPEVIPQGVTYELAPTRPIQAIELINQHPIDPELLSESMAEEVEPIEVFIKEEIVNESKEVNNGVEGIEARKKAPKKQTKKGKR